MIHKVIKVVVVEKGYRVKEERRRNRMEEGISGFLAHKKRKLGLERVCGPSNMACASLASCRRRVRCWHGQSQCCRLAVMACADRGGGSVTEWRDIY